MLSEKTRMALLHPDICHREQEFSEILTRIRYNLLSLYGASNNHRYTSIVLTGSGSAANETVLSSVSPMVKKALIVSNGEFGERLVGISCKYMEKNHLRYDWGQPIRPADIEKRIADDRSIRMVCMVHHETSTGMLNPISQVGEVTKKHGRLFFVDAISSLGAETVGVERNSITFCTSAANKAIGAPPGLSFVCCERSVLEQMKDLPSPTSYLDMFKHYQYEEQLMQTPHTPALHLFFALDAALSDVVRDGLEERARRYEKLAKTLRSSLKELGLSFFIREALMSTVLTTVNLPTGIDPNTLHDRLRERGYVVYLGKGELKQRVFQVANMGAISEREIAGFLRTLRNILLELGSH
jgi:2-aminoethylphosphonate-pyruvate transaminase